MDIRNMIADVFAAHGIGEVDIAVLPRIIDDLTNKIEAVIIDERNDAFKKGYHNITMIDFG